MRRGNHRTKAAETLKKKSGGFTTNPDPSTSRELKRKRNVSFVDVDPHRNHSPTGPSKTSEFAFFNKLKSSFGLSSESKCSNEVRQNPKAFESRSKPGGTTDPEAKDIGNTTCNFSTPICNARRGSPLNLPPKDKEKEHGKCSLGFSRDKDTVRSGNSNLTCGGGSSDEMEDFFSLKRKRLNQWVKHTWFPQIIPHLSSNGGDLVSLLLTRLFPPTEESHLSRFSKERTDRVNRRTFLNSPGSKFLKRPHESYTDGGHRLQTERNKSISCRRWLENSIVPSHVHDSLIPRAPEDFSFSISYPKELVYRPPLLTQKASFPFEETLDSSLHFRNYKSLSLGYHGEEIGYSSEALSHDHKEPSSALLLEWNTENTSTRETDDLPLSYHTKLITYPNASSSSLADSPWSSDYSSSHDVVTRELYPIPLLSDYSSGSFLLPTTNETSHSEHEFERHMIDDEDVVADLQTFHHANSSSDCLTRGYTYYHSHSSSPFPFRFRASAIQICWKRKVQLKAISGGYEFRGAAKELLQTSLVAT
ncbi:unnamed protein product, partial [Eruca vesicaria subsp. sativa]|nr:unnamed protein product [Eruca vesicaria subsp. sativa]